MILAKTDLLKRIMEVGSAAGSLTHRTCIRDLLTILAGRVHQVTV